MTNTESLSSCCGASMNEYFNDDTGFCRECRDHCEYIDVCDECGEEECTCTTFTDGEKVVTDRGIIVLEDDTCEVNKLISNEREYSPSPMDAEIDANISAMLTRAAYCIGILAAASYVLGFASGVAQ